MEKKSVDITPVEIDSVTGDVASTVNAGQSRARRLTAAGVLVALLATTAVVTLGGSTSGTERAGAVVSASAVPGTNNTVKPTSQAASAPQATNKVATKTTSKPSTKPSTKQSAKPSTKPSAATTQPAPTIVVSATTPAPTTPATAPANTGKGGSFTGSQFPNGATVGKDIAAGRYWATNCWSWSVGSNEGTVAQSSYNFTQSVIDVRNGEFFLTSTKCTWNAGNPPAMSPLPTGKVIVGVQLTPGRYRTVKMDGCVTGPTSTRDRAAITDPSQMIVWWPGTKDLVVTGNEGWSSYLVGLECGGLVKVG